MFEFFRTHQKAMQFVLLLLIIPSFALFGLDSYTRFRDSAEPYAEVGGVPVKPEEFDFSKRQQLERLRQQLGAAFDPSLMNSPAVDQAVLDDLVQEKTSAWVITQERLSASDTRLREVIAQIPELQEGGKFSMTRYKSLLAAQGRTPEMFEAGLRDDLSKQQVHGPVAISEFLPVAVKQRLLEIQNAPRTIATVVFSADAYLSQAKVTDEQIAQYYKANEAGFKTPETADIEYLVLSPDDVAASITVTDADALAFYQQNKPRYASAEQRQVRHILYAAGKDAASADKARAREKADAALAKIKADPKQFAAIAKAESQDPGSASQGGDLGAFGRGMMVKPFEDAAFGLAKDAISGVVESEFGFHIIQVTDIIGSVTRPFEEVKAELLAEIRRQQATSKFAEQAEAFTNLAFDQPDSLKPMVDRFKLQPKSAKITARQVLRGVPANNPLGNGEFINSLFTDDVLKKGNNSKALTVGGAVVTARVVKYAPAATRPLESVSDSIKVIVQKTEAAKLAVDAGKQALEKALKGEPLSWSPDVQVSRAKPGALAPEAVSAALKADSKSLPAYTGAVVGENGYVLVKVLAAPAYTAPDLSDAKVATDPKLRSWQEAISQSAGLASANAAKAASKTKTLKTFREQSS
jgi:peptidyl-prolyl cis-trans isomerase D